MIYMEMTGFDGRDGRRSFPEATGDGTQYEVGVDDEGVVIFSECCADRMSQDTMAELYDALGAWLTDHPRPKRART